MRTFECRYALSVREDSRIFIAAETFAQAESIFERWALRNRVLVNDAPYPLQSMREVSPHFLTEASVTDAA